MSENTVVDGAHIRAMSLKRAVKAFERRFACEVHALRYERASRRFIRHSMSLQAVLHLQTMFERSQKSVSVGESCALAFRD
jgi:hypothetical protein